MNHIVDTCPLTTFEADDDAVMWLESTATAALAHYTMQQYTMQELDVNS